MDNFDYYADMLYKINDDLLFYLLKVKKEEVVFDKNIYLEFIYNITYNRYQTCNKLLNDDSITNKDLAWCNKGLDVVDMYISTHMSIGMENGVSYSEIMDIMTKAKSDMNIKNEEKEKKELEKFYKKIRLTKEEFLNNVNSFTNKEASVCYVTFLQHAASISEDESLFETILQEADTILKTQEPKDLIELITNNIFKNLENITINT